MSVRVSLLCVCRAGGLIGAWREEGEGGKGRLFMCHDLYSMCVCVFIGTQLICQRSSCLNCR